MKKINLSFLRKRVHLFHIGAIKRLTNLSEFSIILIELQSGAYIGEDDIERLEDNNGRN